jgi:hypothetical protein
MGLFLKVVILSEVAKGRGVEEPALSEVEGTCG